MYMSRPQYNPSDIAGGSRRRRNRNRNSTKRRRRRTRHVKNRGGGKGTDILNELKDKFDKP